MEDKLPVAHFDGMASIGPALETDNDIRIQREKINDLGFSFIAPLGADYNTIWHRSFSKKNAKGKDRAFPDPFFASIIEKKF